MIPCPCCYATQIKMRPNSFYSNDLLEIDEIDIEGCSTPGFFKKEILFDFLRENPHTIQVNIYPYPDLIPAISVNREKYVRSTLDNTTRDNLLRLPRV